MEEQYIKTDSLLCAAAVKSFHYSIQVDLVDNTDRAVFSIPKNPTTEKIVSDFWGNQLLVYPIPFNAAKFELVRQINQLKEQQ